MYPELFRIGSFPINTYGVFLAIAFLCGILITAKLAARDGLPRERVYDLCLWMLLASLDRLEAPDALHGARVSRQPAQLLSLDFLRSGGVFYGGLSGAVLVGYFLMKRYKLPWWKTADACAPGIAIGNFFGARAALPRDVAGVNRRRCRGACSSASWATKSPACPSTSTSSHTALRIVRDAACVLLSAVAAQAQTIQRPGDPCLRLALFDRSASPSNSCATIRAATFSA
jgi:hypothetical protein